MNIRTFIIFLITALVFAGSNASSQVFYGGLQLGINGSQIWGDQMSGFNKGGVLAGVFVDFPVSKKIYFSMEMNYMQKGSRRMIDEYNQNPGLWNLLRISYFEMPIFFNYRCYEKVDLNIAFSHGIKVGVKYVDLNGIEDPQYDFIRPYEFGIYAGGNYRASKKFIFTYRAGGSLVTIGEGKSKPIWAKTNTGMINIVISCSVKYYFLSPK
jgi:hypothetical protein